MPFRIIRNDITKLAVDAIANGANTNLQMDGGVCGAVFDAAGADRCAASIPSSSILKITGLIADPCPAPCSVGKSDPPSIYPHFINPEFPEFILSIQCRLI